MTAAEIAGQRGNPVLAAQAYVDLARRTRDPGIYQRAVEIALQARAGESALMAARAANPALGDELKRAVAKAAGVR